MTGKERWELALAAGRETLERRQNQQCKVFSLKIDESHLNLMQKDYLKRIFLEAKWYTNKLLSFPSLWEGDILDFKKKSKKEVEVKTVDGTETRPLLYFKSQNQGAAYDALIWAIKGLSSSKKKGRKVGKLKFKKSVDVITYPQFRVSWDWKDDRIKLSGCKSFFKVEGLDQLPAEKEFSIAKLVRKPSGYYIQLTVFIPKVARVKTGKSVGLDFGIKDTIVTSDGEKFNVKVPPTKKLKHLQKIASRKQKGSKNRRKANDKTAQEYERVKNQKTDQVNKIVSKLKKENDVIYIQDELISLWQKGWFGKQVQNSALGAIKGKLKALPSTRVLSSRFPTTKLCYQCGRIHSELTLGDRVFKCECGLEEDRDIKAARTILIVGQMKFDSRPEQTSTPVEGLASIVEACFDDKSSSMKQEAPSL